MPSKLAGPIKHHDGCTPKSVHCQQCFGLDFFSTDPDPAFRLNTDPVPDPDPTPNQGFDDKNVKKLQLKFLYIYFFKSKLQNTDCQFMFSLVCA